MNNKKIVVKIKGRKLEFEEKLRRRTENEDPFIKHLRSVLPRDGNWEVFK